MTDETIELYWDDDAQTIMLAYFRKGWTWAGMFDTLRDIQRVTGRRRELIGAIVQIEPGANVPNGNVFSRETREKARQMLQMGAAGKGPIAVVGMNAVVQVIAKGFTILDRRALDDVYFTDNIAEARRVIRERLDAVNRR
ncbi:MAG: hypothetical protein EA396_07530 [Anaerolineaceae bacterium]|nr:MAG: hypothetical protein EA396_07530 [Anaerolineaceae bacterium]